jgi:putative glutathione S-transferase
VITKAPFPAEQSEDGEFVRQDDVFRDWISADGSTPYSVAAGRYHLYISLACPWPCRTLIVRILKGLEHAVSVTVVDPIRDERGWAFRDGPGCTTDPLNGFAFLREAYVASDPSFQGRVTVPVLWDKETRRIVNNSEDKLCRMFNSFGALGRHDVFPRAIETEHPRLAKFIHDYSTTAFTARALPTRNVPTKRPSIRSSARSTNSTGDCPRNGYLFGARIVEADWRLFCTLIRFDAVYYVHFKCNLRRIVDYPNLHGYMLDLYQQPGIAGTVNLDHIKRHYYCTHDDINPLRIVPVGPELDLTRPHGRERST